MNQEGLKPILITIYLTYFSQVISPMKMQGGSACRTIRDEKRMKSDSVDGPLWYDCVLPGLEPAVTEVTTGVIQNE